MAVSRIVEGYEEAQVAFAEAGAITTLIQARTTNHKSGFFQTTSHGLFWENYWFFATVPGVGNCPILGILDIT